MDEQIVGLGGSAQPTVAQLQEAALRHHKATTTLAEVEAKMKELIKPYVDAVAQAERTLAAMMKSSGVESVGISMGDEADSGNIEYAFMPKQAPKVLDWDEFYTWIRDNNRFDMLHKRVSAAPVVELWQMAEDEFAQLEPGTYDDVESFVLAEGKLPPGVTVSEWKELTARVVKKRKARRASR